MKGSEAGSAIPSDLQAIDILGQRMEELKGLGNDSWLVGGTVECPISGQTTVTVSDSTPVGVKQVANVGLRNCEEALEAVANGTYGICVDCKKPIDQERMNAIPEATRCCSCQTIFNKRRKGLR